MKKRSKALILSSLLLGGIVLSTATSCGNLPDIPGLDQETDKKYSIANPIITPAEGGSFSIDPALATGNVGKEVPFIITANEGYELETLKINGTVVDNTTRKFTPIEGTNTIEITFKTTGTDNPDGPGEGGDTNPDNPDHGGETEKTGTVTVATVENGTLSATPLEGKVGTEITVTAQANEGFEVDYVKANDETLTANAEGKYTFSLKENENSVTGAFKVKETQPTVKPEASTFNLLFKPSAEMGMNAENAHVYLFNETDNNGWPGEKLVETATEGIFGFNLPDPNIYTGVIFNTGDVDTKQTVDIDFTYKTDVYKVYTITGLEDSKFTGEWQDLEGVKNPDIPVITHKFVYFQDSKWWSEGYAKTSIRVFKDTEKLAEEVMDYIGWNEEGSVNQYKFDLGYYEGANKIQFLRTDKDSKGEDWGASTKVLDIPNLEEKDYFILNDKCVMQHDVVETELHKYVAGEYVDPQPVIEPTKYVYFQDAQWWHKDNSKVAISLYKADLTLIKEDRMEWVAWNDEAKKNVLRYNIYGVEEVAKVSFTRCNDGGNITNLGTTTPVYDLPNLEEKDLFVIHDEPQIGEGKAEAELHKYVEGTWVTPTPLPEPEVKPEADTFKYLVKVLPEMNFNAFNAYAFMFGSKDGAEVNNHAWPGEKMTLTATPNVFGFTPREDDANAPFYTTIIFNNDGGKQTVNISLEKRTDEYKMYTVITGSNKDFTGSWTNLEGKEPALPEAEKIPSKSIYLRTSNWFHQTNALIYAQPFDSNEKPLYEGNGIKLEDGKLDSASGFKYWTYQTPENTATIKFARYGDNDGTINYWGATTRLIDLRTELGENDMIVFPETEAWSGDFDVTFDKYVEPEPEPTVRPDAKTFKYLVKVTPEMNFTEFNAHAYLFYKEGEQEFKNHDWPGEKMTLTSTDNVYGFTPREDDVNASKYTTIIFNNNAGKQTADISLVDRTDEFKMLTITGEKEGKFEGKWTNLAGVEPEKPVAKEYGTYKIYVRDNANWAIDNKLGIHHWGSATKPENPAKDAFPNSTMKLVEGEKNLYEIDLLMKENVGFIIAKTDKSAQTKDIKLTTEQLDGFGKDASIEIVIGKADPNANNNYNFEVKAYTPGTPTPEPEKPVPVEKTTFTLNVPAGWDDKGIQIRIYFYSEADEKGYMDQITLAKSETDHAERFEITFELPNNVNYIKLEQITLVPNQDPVYGAKTNAFEVATARKEGKTLITVADDNTVTITKIEVAA